MKRLGFGGGKDDAKSRAKAAVPEDAPALYDSGDVEETVVVVGDTTHNVVASVDVTILKQTYQKTKEVPKVKESIVYSPFHGNAS